MKIYHVYIIVYHLNNVLSIFLRANLIEKKHIKPRKNINRIFNNEQGDGMFLNIDKYEYPRINETLRQLHKQQWLDYYECLKERYADVGYEKITYPTALSALEGTSVNLTCQICISPAEIYIVNLVKWYFNSSSNTSIIKSPVEKENHIFNSPDNQRIIIYKLKLEQAGQYWCEIGDTIGSLHYLYIESDSKTINVVYPDTAPYVPQSASIEILSKYDLKIYTSWTTWSSCSTCDTVGIKIRYGYCTISSLKISQYKYIVDKNVAIIDELRCKRAQVGYGRNETENIIYKTTINKDLKTRLKTALLLFRNKLPCKSRFIPKKIQIIPAIKNRKIEMMKGYCKKKCLKNVIFEVRDEKGNILESANNSAGIYSMIQEMPLVPSPMIARIILYKRYNKKLKLICPGYCKISGFILSQLRNLNTDAPIIWQIGDKVIVPSRIKHQSNGRIYINPLMHIVFESLKFEDANIYSCRQNNELIGVIKLNVTGEIELKINHHVLFIGAIFIISIFIIIFWRAFKGRTRHTIH